MKKRIVLLLTVILVLAAGCALADETGPCGDNLVYEFNSSTFHMDIYLDDFSQDAGAITKTDWSNTVRNSTKTISIYDGTEIGLGVFEDFSDLYSVGLPDGRQQR